MVGAHIDFPELAFSRKNVLKELMPIPTDPYDIDALALEIIDEIQSIRDQVEQSKETLETPNGLYSIEEKEFWKWRTRCQYAIAIKRIQVHELYKMNGGGLTRLRAKVKHLVVEGNKEHNKFILLERENRQLKRTLRSVYLALTGEIEKGPSSVILEMFPEWDGNKQVNKEQKK